MRRAAHPEKAGTSPRFFRGSNVAATRKKDIDNARSFFSVAIAYLKQMHLVAFSIRRVHVHVRAVLCKI